MEAEGPHLHQQARDLAGGDARGGEAVAHQLEVGGERGRRVVAARLAADRAVEPAVDQPELAAERLVRVALAGLDVGQLALVALDRGAQRGGEEDVVVGLRELPREVVDALAQQPQRRRAVHLERARDRLRRHLGVAVHVAAGPRAEAQRRLQRRPGDVEAARQLGRQRRDRVEQDRLEEEQRAPHLVLDARPHAADLVGLPPGRQHLAQLVLQRAAAGRADARVVELLHDPPDRLLVVEDRAARRLGRVGGHHEPHVELREPLGDPAARHLADGADGRRQRLALRHARVGVVLAAAPQPLQLLGDVGQLQLHRAGAHVRRQPRRRLAAQEGQQLLALGLVAVAQRERAVAQPEQPLAEGAPVLLLQHVAEQALEQGGVAVERVGGGGGGHVHLATIVARCGVEQLFRW